MIEQGGSVDALIREEKRLTAVESHHEAWAEGLACGIEPEIMAEAALTTALEELQRACGEDTATALLDRIRERMVAGDFAPQTTRH